MVLIKILCIFLIPFLLFLLLLNVYCNTVYTQRLAQNNRTRLAMYESFIEEDLAHVQYFMSDMIANDVTFTSIRYPLSDVNSYLQGQVLREKFESFMKSIDGISAFCVLSSETDFFSGAYARENTYVEKENIQAYLQNLVAEEEDVITDWRIQKIGDEYYFIKIMGQGHAYCSCLIAANNLSRKQDDSYLLFENGGEYISYGDKMKELGVKFREDKLSYRSGSDGNQFIVQGYSDLLHANILLVEEYHGIWSMQSIPFFMVMISLFFAALIVLCYRMLKKGFLSPLEDMVETMEQIRDGETESRLHIVSEVQEFHKINITFNSMMDRIRKLKLLAYDRMIQMQQTQLQYYQIQIRPHFYLNCISVIHGMAEKYHADDIIMIAEKLSDYFRYVINDSYVLRQIGQEVAHIRDYIDIQKLRYEDFFRFEVMMDEGVEECMIPPLVLQVFVENAINHGVNFEKQVEITLYIAREQYRGKDYLYICVSDTGEGFSKEALHKIQNGGNIVYNGRKHVGIQNTLKRLQIIYGEKAQVSFFNMTEHCGAVVELRIPVQVQEG